MIGIGLAIPAIEAWYLCGVDPHAIEAALIAREDARSRRLRNELKRKVYGSDRPPLTREIEIATQAAKRLAANIELLERLFPNGFGTMANQIRRWTLSDLDPEVE